MICEKSASANAVQLSTEDKALFEDYLRDLDVVYARTDEMLGACGVEPRPVISYRMGPERKFEGDWEFQDSLDVRLIPFTFEQTCSAMWQSMAHVHRQKDRSHYAGVVDPDNTIAVKFRLCCPSTDGEPAALLVHLAMRRYVEAERMVLVWRALSDGEGAFSGMHSDETGWSIVRPNDVSDEEERTIMQTYVRLTPMNVPRGSSDQITTDQFVKLVVTSVDEDAAEVGRMMDSLLL